jgi:hypothetical protein
MSHIYRDHPDFGGEVDHAELVERLERDYDGWALSTSERALGEVLPLCPWESWEFRVCVWRRGCARPIGRSRIMYAWEPLLVKTPRWESLPWIADTAFIPQNLSGQSLRGQKPEAFAFWMFGLLGVTPEDEFTDLFPGSGAIGRAWDAWSSQQRIAV